MTKEMEQYQFYGRQRRQRHPAKKLEPREITRRDMLHLTGWAGLMLLSAGFACRSEIESAAKSEYETIRRHEARPDAQNLFNYLVGSARKFSIFSGIVGVEPDVKVSSSMFREKNVSVWKNNQLNVLLRPIGVQQMLLRNIADQSTHTQDMVDRVINEVSPGLIAFYPAKGSELVYLDVDKNQGRILPVEFYGDPMVGSNQEALPLMDVDTTGVDERADHFYPFVESNYTWPQTVIMGTNGTPVEYEFIGQNITDAGGMSFGDMAGYVINGIEPVGFPSPYA